MRALTVVVALLITGCSGGYQPIPASEPVALAARIDASVAARAEEDAAAAAAAKKAHNEKVAARAEARTTYVAQHRDARPAAVVEALLAGDRIVLGMTGEEVLLVVETAALVDRIVSEKGVVEHWTAAAAPVTGLTFANGTLFSWTTNAGHAAPDQTTALMKTGEQVAVSVAQ